MLEVRLRSRISQAELELKKGKILAPSDLNLVITGDCRVIKPNGTVLCVVRKAAIPDSVLNKAYPILHSIKMQSDNRGYASGAPTIMVKRRTRSLPVRSGIIGFKDAQGAPEQRYCRLTAWTGQHMPEWQALNPYFRTIAAVFAAETSIKDRYDNQMRVVGKTRADWVVPGTPFSTVTVNNTYSTGVHVDDGDLQEGFSCLSVLRNGEYTGGILTFPEFRIGADLDTGDVILMDAHEWHGNTEIVATGKASEDYERISVVCYYRTDMKECGTPDQELAKIKSKRGALT